MPNKFLAALQLARLHIPTSYLLPFFIASLGGILGSSSVSDLKIFPLFFAGSVVARGAGCIINDVFDRKFDSLVERTKNRPLANQSITLNFALWELSIFLLLSLLTLFFLPATAIYLSLIAGAMTALYPLMKRITYLPQVFLGATYSMASLIGYASVANKISSDSVILYFGIVFWTIGFDTIYGFMDREDDKKIQVKSLAILIENKNYKTWLTVFYSIFVVLFITSLTYSYPISSLPYYFYFGVFLSFTILMWQVTSLDITDPANCLKRFKSNNLVALILIISMLGAKQFFSL